MSVQFLSPVSVSNGEDNITNSDVLRDYDGIPFIPGSSLAGALRNYLLVDNDEKCIFGCTEQEDGIGRMSRLFFSDLQFSDDIQIVTRDGVELSKEKIAVTEKKYEMEAVDTGQKELL